ncbi:MAG: energy transducer TonB [Betaproteobacteria bacterium]|nr:energy transducer TonB [Betaproteobacteria bacterium]
MGDAPHGARQADTGQGFWRALPLAALLWALMLAVLGRFLAVPARPSPMPAVDARIVELRAPGVGRPLARALAPARKPRVIGVHREAGKAMHRPAIIPRESRKPSSKVSPVARHPAPIAKPAAEAQPGAAAADAGDAPPTRILPQGIPEAQGAPRPATAGVTPAALPRADSGPQATYQPRPRLPAWALREEIDATAVALFHVAADGSATVELARPADDPRLNDVILRALRQWRFRPALKAGKPIASLLKVPVRLQVH